MIRCVDADVREPDVIVVGGGPAGATTATLIAQQGYAVRLFERERFPRYHVGESLIPETFWVFERLGMIDRLRQASFVKKRSVQFVTGTGKLSEPFYFQDHKPHESSQTWQVLRSEFDCMMLDNARAAGVEVHEGVRVLEVLFDGPRAVGVAIADDLAPGGRREIHAAVVVDAAGQSTLIQDRLGLREWDPVLKKAALWTYWQGAQRDGGRDEGATLVMQLDNKLGWFWYIPLHDDVVSVGVVAPFDYLFKNRAAKDHETIYMEEVARCPGVQPRRGQGILVSLVEGGRRRLGARGRRLWIPGSALLVRDSPGAQERGARGRCDLGRPRSWRHLRDRARLLGARVRRWPRADAEARVRLLRRPQLRPARPTAR